MATLAAQTSHVNHGLLGPRIFPGGGPSSTTDVEESGVSAVEPGSGGEIPEMLILSSSQPDSLPGVAYGFLFRFTFSEEIRCGGYGLLGAVSEVGLGFQAVGQGLVPDLSRLLPGEAANRRGGQIKRVVGNAGVGVHAAVVLGGLYVTFHRPGLRVFSKHGIVVGRARRFH